MGELLAISLLLMQPNTGHFSQVVPYRGISTQCLWLLE